MKVTLYVATSIDGFIAKKDGDSDWVSKTDQEVFYQKASEKGCIILGRRTFEQYHGVFYPLKDVDNIVLTRATDKVTKEDNVKFASSPKEILKVAADLGHNEVLLVGGGKTNGAFLEENLIDEVFFSVHPIILGQGIKIFEGTEKVVNLKTLGTKNLDEGLVQIYFKVIR